MKFEKKYLLLTVIPIIIVILLLLPVATNYTVITHEKLQITDYIGNVSFYLNDTYVGTYSNNMTYIGDDSINNRLFNSSWTGAVWNYIAIGTGTGGNKSNTALVTEIDRELAAYYKPGDAQWGLNYTFSFAASYTITEAGILNASSGGTLAFYVWNLNIGVTSADTLKICWKGTTTGY